MSNRTRQAPRWLLAIVLVLIAANLLEVAGTLAIMPQYAVLPVPFPAALRMVIAGGWAIVLTVLLLRLFRRDARALNWTAPILTLYALTGLVWLILFARADYDRGRIGFQMVLAIVTLLPVWLNGSAGRRRDTPGNA
ncbi:MAG: hypothetical protein IT324_10940 [Anaerolineae bacterium]|nr:hypothetical protein [Anaerolineae bacterium]